MSSKDEILEARLDELRKQIQEGQGDPHISCWDDNFTDADMSLSIEEVKEELSVMVRSFANSIERTWGYEGLDFLDIVTSEMRILGYEARNKLYDKEQGINLPNSDSRKNLKASLKRFVFERDEYRCVKCGTHVNLSIDHIHPFSKGGSDDESNLQTLCRSCNSSKGASLGS